MSDKNIARVRRAKQTRHKIREIGAVRLTVHRSNAHIYAQLTSPSGDKVLATASSLEKEIRGQIKNGGNAKAAAVVGERIAQKAKDKGIDKVAFDRAGYRYHGRVKALADAARAAGLKF
jgi:large subunit ribosomal protein L18